MTEGTQSLTNGDRVTVTDLRTGQHYTGTVVKATPDPADGTLRFVNVKYDSGVTVRVGVTFVRREDA